MASTKDAVYRRILDYIEGFARSPQDLRNICSLVCELKSPQLAYYVLFYCGKHKIPEELLGQLFGAVLSEQESSLDESSYCNLTLVNVEGLLLICDSCYLNRLRCLHSHAKETERWGKQPHATKERMPSGSVG